MSDLGLLFTGDLVPLLLDGRKTSTLRPITPSNSLVNGYGQRSFPEGQDWLRAFVDPGPSPAGNSGPYLHVPRAEGEDEMVDRVYPRASPGDRIWCRETWATCDPMPTPCRVAYRADGMCVGIGHDGEGGTARIHHGWVHGFADQNRSGVWRGLDFYGGRWRPSIHMPRWACRWTSPPLLAVEPVRLDALAYEQARADGFATQAECLIRIDETYGRWPAWPWLWRYVWEVSRG